MNNNVWNFDEKTNFKANSKTIFFGPKLWNKIEEADAAYLGEYYYIKVNNLGLGIPSEEFDLFIFSIVNVIKQSIEYNDEDEVEFSCDEWKMMLEEAGKLLSYDSFDDLFEYMVNLNIKDKRDKNRNIQLAKLNFCGKEFWDNKEKYKEQLDDVVKWCEIVIKDNDKVKLSLNY